MSRKPKMFLLMCLCVTVHPYVHVCMCTVSCKRTIAHNRKLWCTTYRVTRLWPLLLRRRPSGYAMLHSHGVDSNYTSTNMFEIHGRNQAFANGACFLIWCLWSRCVAGNIILLECQISARRKEHPISSCRSVQHITATIHCVSSPNSLRCCGKNETGAGLLIEAVTLPGFH